MGPGAVMINKLQNKARSGQIWPLLVPGIFPISASNPKSLL